MKPTREEVGKRILALLSRESGDYRYWHQSVNGCDVHKAIMALYDALHDHAKDSCMPSVKSKCDACGGTGKVMKFTVTSTATVNTEKPAPVAERTMPCDNCGESRPVSERDHASGILICPECTRDPKRRKPEPVAAPAPLDEEGLDRQISKRLVADRRDEEGLVEKVAKAFCRNINNGDATAWNHYTQLSRAAIAAMREAGWGPLETRRMNE